MNSKTSSLQQLKSLLLVPTLFLLPLLTPQVADAAVKIKNTNYRIPNNAYFVSPNGRNNNSGKSPRSPIPVEKAIADARPGATIVFRGGTYRGVDAKITKKLTLQAYPREEPLLKGSTVVKGWVADGSTWRKDGWTYSFAQDKKTLGNEYIDRKYPMAGYRDMVYVNGNSLKQVGRRDRVSPGTFYVDRGNNKLYIGSNPAGKTVEATTKKMAFDISAKRSTGTMIRGLGFAHYADGGVEVIGTPRVTLENNTFVWNGIYGVLVRKAENATLRGNTFSFNGMNGVRGGWADRMLLEGNTISHNNIEHFRKAWAAAGIKVINTSGVVWRNNMIEHNIGNGMWLDESSTNATIKNNTIRNNEQIGIMFELSHKANITGNKISNNPAGIMIADSSNAQIHGNRFFRNKKHVLIKDSPRKNRDRAEIAKGADWVTRNNVIRNNRMSR